MHDPLQPHSHEPNPAPPSDDPTFTLTLPNRVVQRVQVDDLVKLPYTEIPDCYIVSTGHGTSGPFAFGGVAWADFVEHFLPASSTWTQAEVISGDGFGTRVRRTEVTIDNMRPILIAHTLHHVPLTREQGLVRLIVPSERDDALRQVKWISKIHLLP